MWPLPGFLFCFYQWSFHGRDGSGGGGGGGHATYLEKEVSVLRASMAPWVACRTSFRFRSLQETTTFSSTGNFLPVITYVKNKIIRIIRCYIQKFKINQDKKQEKKPHKQDK
jgi:hypothetical protein